MSTQAVSVRTVSTYLDRVQKNLEGPAKQLSRATTVAALLQHGGFQILITPSKLVKRLHRVLDGASEQEASEAALSMQKVAGQFFQKLCPYAYYGIPSQLMSHLTFPHDSRTYTEPSIPDNTMENPRIAAVFTFVGQFVDHDLTFNGLNLFDVQPNTSKIDETPSNGDTKKVVPDFASPYIDLDSMYGRPYPADTSDPALKELLNKEGMKNVFCGSRFRLTKLGPNAYDLPRWTDASAPNRVGSAWIFDPRNDENQIILQIHILLMRVHNKLVDQMLKTSYPATCDDGIRKNPTLKERECIHEIRKKVVCLWQSVLLNEFLPLVCKSEVLSKILAPGYSFHYKPDAEGALKMPHEFAIAYRFGHSMLRSSYKLNNNGAVPLFDNRNLLNRGDLQGGRALTLEHAIDWDVFYPEDTTLAERSLKIDSHVTSVVFDLPESAVPDDIKTDGNLPKRNLERSRSIELGCGEEVASCLSVADILTNAEVEPDVTTHALFQQDVNVYSTANGHKIVVDHEPFHGKKDTSFKTPLWYYVVREAEVRENGECLGGLGSTVVAEVIVQGIRNGPYKYDCAETELLSGKKGKDIKLRDLIDFVHE